MHNTTSLNDGTGSEQSAQPFTFCTRTSTPTRTCTTTHPCKCTHARPSPLTSTHANTATPTQVRTDACTPNRHRLLTDRRTRTLLPIFSRAPPSAASEGASPGTTTSATRTACEGGASAQLSTLARLARRWPTMERSGGGAACCGGCDSEGACLRVHADG